MGSYAYCRKCDAAMDKPTLEEALNDGWFCRNGHHRELIDSPMEHLVDEFQALVARVEALERQQK